MPEVVKCPACADQKKQECLGELTKQNGREMEPPVVLYRCVACDFLYLVPLDADELARGEP
ncbi:MAG TPA: hypothetical protein VG099_10290 [Gemmataceae bacterium]|jgi:DNA-directed RNA polymerase subunit M/transcription elongation factor TFIIS|nr:hypothetical protein [Gemmataceae bacterium]